MTINRKLLALAAGALALASSTALVGVAATTEKPLTFGKPAPYAPPTLTKPAPYRRPTIGAGGANGTTCRAFYEANERCSSRVSVNVDGKCPSPEECKLYENHQGASTEITPHSTCRVAGNSYSAACVR